MGKILLKFSGSLEHLLLDVRYSCRALRKRPGFAVVATLTLALVIGANTAIFSAIYGLVFKPLPYYQADRLVLIWDANRNTGLDHMTIIGQTFPSLLAHTTSFMSLAGFRSTSSRDAMFAPRIWGTNERIAVSGFTSQLASVLHVAPLFGTTFTPEDEPNRNSDAHSGPIILSYVFWEEHFGASPDVLGKSLVLNEFGFQRPYTIVGVMPKGFDFPYPLVPNKPDVWIHLTYQTAGKFVPAHQFLVVARLRVGTSVRQAQTELTTISQRLEILHPIS